MKYLKYVLKRLLYVVFVFLVVSVLMYAIYKAVPGDPVALMLDSSKKQMDPARYEQLYEQTRERLGLDKPIPVQYGVWLGNMLTGDFGFSTKYKQPVNQIVAAPLENTLMLNLFSLVLAFAITIPLGIVTAVRKNSAFDQTIQVGTIVGYSLPSFVIALVCIYLFAVKMPVFPISGSITAGSTATGMEAFGDRMYHMALPLIVMTLTSLGSITRYTRAAMIDVLSQDYIRTARAKGLREKVVIYSHAFRNALIPLITILTTWLVSAFSGSIVIETIFGWNGIGKLLFDALQQRDFMVVLAMQMFYVLLTLAGNLIMDIGYALVDPRIKLEG
ncbi:MAG: ABC transporter permease [Oscillospiraceae bacterium]|jgi:peptide/nickel transport system permease protein|nr:ABC transporter permease [Oscillospiraceae bacterium]